MRANKARRYEQRTVLLVGEGYAEVAFIEHLKTLYVSRGCGLALTVKNARGKGALHVVDVAIRQSRNAAFDVRAVLLDTDTDWNEKTQAWPARQKCRWCPVVPAWRRCCLHCTARWRKANLQRSINRLLPRALVRRPMTLACMPGTFLLNCWRKPGLARLNLNSCWRCSSLRESAGLHGFYCVNL